MDENQIVNFHLQKGTFRVESDGRIISGRTGKEIATRYSRQSGYAQVGMRDPKGGNYTTNKQRVVWIAHKGPIPDGMVINHLDGDRSNNAISNLECVSKRDNSRHAARNGLLKSGRTKEQQKTRPDLVLENKLLIEENLRLKELVAELQEMLSSR